MQYLLYSREEVPKLSHLWIMRYAKCPFKAVDPLLQAIDDEMVDLEALQALKRFVDLEIDHDEQHKVTKLSGP